MTFTIRLRGAPARVIAAEYLCEVHGRFEVDVERDEAGDPPAAVACPDCGADAQWVISAPLGRVRRVEVTRGGWQKPERETWLDTRNLGEGQELNDWLDDRKKIRERQRQRELKELLE